MRATRHGEEVYPYIFVRGIGVVVRTTPLVSAEDANKYDDMFDKAIRTAADLGASESLLERIEYVKKNWAYSFSPKETLQIFFESQGLTGSIRKEDVEKRKQEAQYIAEHAGEQSAFLADVEKTLVGQEQMSVVPKQKTEGLIDIEELKELEELVK